MPHVAGYVSFMYDPDNMSDELVDEMKEILQESGIKELEAICGPFEAYDDTYGVTTVHVSGFVGGQELSDWLSKYYRSTCYWNKKTDLTDNCCVLEMDQNNLWFWGKLFIYR